MQTVSASFVKAAIASVRSPQAKVTFDWNRNGLPEDDTAYVQSIQVDRLFDQPSSVARAAIDIKMANPDNIFSLNGPSSVSGKVTVGVPSKVRFGFLGELISLFTGIISDYPTFNIADHSVEIFGFDLMDSIGQQLTSSLISGSNKTVDWVLTQIMTQLGYASGQYVFGTGVTVIPTVSIAAGTSIGTIINDLMIAEVGQFWVDESGIFRFQQRNTNPYPVTAFDITDDLVIDSSDLITSYLYNICQVTGPGSTSATYTNAAAVTEFGPQLLQINNPYIQNNTLALDLATYYVIANSSNEPFHIVTMRAIPQLQLGDLVIWNNFTYQVVRIKLTLDTASGFTAQLTLKRFNAGTYFTIGVSSIGGVDALAP